MGSADADITPAMRIRHGTIDGYLMYLTSIELEEVEDPLADMSIYDTAVDAMAAAARRDGHLDLLQLALDALASGPEDQIAAFRGLGYPFSAEQMAALLTHAFERIWPGQTVSAPGEAVPVDFVQISAEDWERERGRA